MKIDFKQRLNKWRARCFMPIFIVIACSSSFMTFDGLSFFFFIFLGLGVVFLLLGEIFARRFEHYFDIICNDNEMTIYEIACQTKRKQEQVRVELRLLCFLLLKEYEVQNDMIVRKTAYLLKKSEVQGEKKTIKCPNCGAPNTIEGKSICQYCGTVLRSHK